MQPARIAELLKPFLDTPDPLTDADLQRISTYIDILLRWNARINLTAIRDEDEIVTRHFGESFFLARHLFPGSHREGFDREGHDFSRANKALECSPALAPGEMANDRSKPALSGAKEPATSDRLSVADIGSGAGFPGIPLKLWTPQIHLALIESNHKKATFLKEVASTLTLTDIDILPIRAEQIDATFDVVTLRAVERFSDVLPAAARLVSPQGRLALLLGTSQLAPAKSLLPAFRWEPPVSIPGSTSRVVQLASRVC